VVAVLAGRRVTLRVAGVALSPEHIFAAAGDLVPDDRRFGILWMGHRAAARAFGMEGAFDDVIVSLERGAVERRVIADLDRVLGAWGGRGARGRDGNLSHRFLTQEIAQLQGTATTVPAVFLGVATFLLNLVLGRLLGTQREQIAALRALGYSKAALAFHYLEMALVVVIVGSVLGALGGVWAGRAFTTLYADYFRFPTLVHRLDVSTLALTSLLATVAATVATLRVVLRATSVPPAQAMRPEAPPTYKPSIIERLGVHRLLSVPARMVARDLERRPFRLLASSLGLALAVSLVIVGRFSLDSIEVLTDLQFSRAQKEDVAVAFTRPLGRRAFLGIAALPGVVHAEPMRSVPVRLTAGTRERETVILGLGEHGLLRPLLDVRGRSVHLPSDGVVMSAELGRRLRRGPGDLVHVESLETGGRRGTTRVAALIDDMIGLFVWMRADALQRWLGEDRGVSSGVLLALDPRASAAVLRRLKGMPAVASVARKDAMLAYFREETAKYMTVFTLFLAAFAAILAVGVVYNNARIALALRARDLATLRVLGLTRGQVSIVLVGEQLVQLLIALGPGLLLGRLFAEGVAATIDAELFRLPVVILPRTYAMAVGVVALASVVSALLVRRRLDRLDLTSALRAKD
ncbi:MAG: ABC transporter permease, partial [Deltaproteobacteria bacterium]|nr:ABC transporter permease [Deltaproteobacteria bacterium]